jgi:hypothetical protein
MDRLAASLPGAIPGAIGSSNPEMPLEANLSMFSGLAASNGVLYLSSCNDRSAIPSPIIMTTRIFPFPFGNVHIVDSITGDGQLDYWLFSDLT